MAAFESIGIIGAGAWGTALAQSCCTAGRRIVLWARSRAVVDEINGRHTNDALLSGVALDPRIKATSSIGEAAACDCVLMVTPAQHMREVAQQLATVLAPGKPVVICSKGIEQSSGRMLGDVLAEVLPAARIAVLSGPSFAADVSRGLPAALTVACGEQELGRQLAESLGSRPFRLYWSSDLIGVQLGGSVKNVLAIAAGIVDGRALGASAHAALVTRGFAELRRFGAALGARPETLMGLSGLGDLLLTCGSPQSRNMSLGRAIGQGQAAAHVLGGRRSVAEGVHTAAAVAAIAREKALEMPICDAVLAVVESRLAVDEAIGGLLARPFKAEM